MAERSSTVFSSTDVRALTLSLTALADGTRWAEALEILASAPAARLDPDILTLNAVFDALERGGRGQDVSQLYEEAVAAGALPPPLITSGRVLDLHDLPVQVAVAAVRATISGASRQAKLDHSVAQRGLLIITGQGMHSSDSEAVVQPAVKDVLRREGVLAFAPARFVGPRKGPKQAAGQEPGMLVVPPNELRRFWDRHRLGQSGLSQAASDRGCGRDRLPAGRRSSASRSG
ncbi:unnamed protein product, partial [Polarella glacialis]